LYKHTEECMCGDCSGPLRPIPNKLLGLSLHKEMADEMKSCEYCFC